MKFRFWDKEESIMYKNCANLAISSEGGVSELISHDEYLIWGGIAYYEHIIPLQYIGQKDKNEKEIYDGDYVLINHPERFGYGSKSIFKITKIKGLLGYEYTWECIKGYPCITHILEDDYSNCEVVGNIYETDLSQLLEVC